MELLTFVDGFDHHPLAWNTAKITTVQGSAISLVPGPYHGDGVRFSGGGNGYWPALTGEYAFATAGNGFWDSGGWSAQVRVSASGFGGQYVVLLQTAWYDYTGSVVDFHHHELRLFSDGHLACYVMPASGNEAAMDLIPGSASSAGAFPFDQWVTLEYRTLIGRGTPRGSVGYRIAEGTPLEVTGVATASEERAIVQARYFRFGNLRANGNTVTVDVDDVAARGDTVLGAVALPWWGTHRVACVLPVGPGDSAGHGLVGAATNWVACAALPATPATTDTAYVTKASGSRPVDLYAMGALPLIVPTEGAGAFAWHLARTTGGTGDVTRRVQDAVGGATAGRSTSTSPPHFLVSNVATNSLTGLTDAHLAGLQVGWGNAVSTPDTTGEVYEGTHVTVELWYRPAEEPPPEPGAQHWSVGWVG